MKCTLLCNIHFMFLGPHPAGAKNKKSERWAEATMLTNHARSDSEMHDRKEKLCQREKQQLITMDILKI